MNGYLRRNKMEEWEEDMEDNSFTSYEEYGEWLDEYLNELKKTA